MWNWFNCYLSGRHDYGMWCEPGAIFLRCLRCGKRSPGWTIDPKVRAKSSKRPTPIIVEAVTPAGRVIPFERATAR